MAEKKTKVINDRKIPRRNYLIAFLLVIGITIVTIYGFKLYNLYHDELIANSYLMKTNTVLHEMKSIEELSSVMSEAPDEYFIYISYTGKKEIYELEKDLKTIIEDYKLKDYMYYLNVTKMKEKSDYLNSINEILNTNIKKVPTILFFRDGKLVSGGIVEREDELMMQAGDFADLLDRFEISKSR